MKAAVINEYGSSEVIKIVEDALKPSARDGLVVVEVHAASINPFDYKVNSGAMKDSIPLQFPKTLGMDMAGVINEVGSANENLKVGDEVYGQAAFFSGGGAIAEFTLAKPSSLALKPNNISFVEAAGLPLTAVSAYQALVDNMSLSSGQKLLIHGGAGGIGSIAIQLAKHLGASIATTCAGKDIDYVKGLGAEVVINYETEDFAKIIKDYDAVFDLIGGEVYKKSFEVLKPNGILVSMMQEPDSELSEKYNVRARHQSTKVDSQSLNNVRELVEQVVIKPQIEKDYPIEQTASAFDVLEHDHPKGKVVIKIKD